MSSQPTGRRRARGSSGRSSGAAAWFVMARGCSSGGLSSAGMARYVRSRTRRMAAGSSAPTAPFPSRPSRDADTQAVTVAALRATARLSGDARWTLLAERMVERIASAFTPETIAVDGRDRRVSGAGSHLGWLLWADALPASERDSLRRAALSARRGRPTSAFGRCPRSIPSSQRPHITGVPSGRLTPGSDGAVYAPRVALTMPNVCVVAYWPRWSGWETRPSSTRSRPVAPTPIPIANRVQAWTAGARFALEQRWDGRFSP